MSSRRTTSPRLSRSLSVLSTLFRVWTSPVTLCWLDGTFHTLTPSMFMCSVRLEDMLTWYRISRLGINFGNIPVNLPVCPFATTQQDGHGQMFSKRNRTRYHPNRHDALPVTTPANGGFASYPEKVQGIKERAVGPKFKEHINQATLFYNSMSEPEKKHMISAAQFELGKVEELEVQQTAIERFNLIDHGFALAVAEAFTNIKVPDEVTPNHGKRSEFLSQVNGKNQVFTAAGRKVGIFVQPGFNWSEVAPLQAAFAAAGLIVMIVGPASGPVKASNGQEIKTQFTFEVCPSVFSPYLCTQELTSW